MAMTSACLAQLVPAEWFEHLRLLPHGALKTSPSTVICPPRPVVTAAATCLVFAAVLGYGFVRRGQAEFRSGPNVALIQGNFPSEVKHDSDSWREMLNTHSTDWERWHSFPLHRLR